MSDADSIRARVADYYSGRLREHGVSARGVAWRDGESQELRFRMLDRVFGDGPGAASVLDVGCGYGAYADHLRDLGHSGRYTGVDWSRDMLDAGTVRAQGIPTRRFVHPDDSVEVHEYVIASGIFNVRLDIGDAPWETHVWAVLDQMWSDASVGIAANFLTSHSDVDHQRDDLYYADPAQVLDRSLRRYGRDADVRHGYGLYEFTLIVWRPGA